MGKLEKLTGIIVSYQDFEKFEGKQAFYMFPYSTNEIIALEPIPDRDVSVGKGYVIIDGAYIRCVNLAG